MKKIMLMALFLLILFPVITVSAQDQAPNWYLKSLGGVVATDAQLQKGEVSGTAKIEFVRLVYKDKIAIGGSYWDINNGDQQWEDYAGKIYFFGRNPKLEHFYPYLFIAGAVTHDPDGEKALGDFTYDGGFGVIIPFIGVDFVGEFGAKHVDKDWLLSLTSGLQIGLDF